ncbi:hypothetical protein [Alkalicoccus luteus]|uniref:hypothetical protein n=1 Tax=Alkalicoccus luteus TaxID=1237094 RepID=UPI00143926C9|nr:hypothetical protein [Alkalicoccus luteus]
MNVNNQQGFALLYAMMLLLLMSTSALLIVSDLNNLHQLHEQEMNRKQTGMLQQTAMEFLIRSDFRGYLEWEHDQERILVWHEPIDETTIYVTVTSGSYTREAEFVYNEESRQISAWKERVWSHD